MNIPVNYSLVDAFDKLSKCTNTDDTWLTVVNIARKLGVDAINVGRIDIEKAALLWGRSSMTQSWLETYVARNFAKVDPLVKLFAPASSSSRKTIYCDDASIAAGTHGGHPELSKGLNEAGYVLLHGTKFTDPADPYGTIVTLCFSSMDRDAFDSNVSFWTTFSALIAGFSVVPGGAHDVDVFDFGTPELSPREKEVLSYLAQGLKIARIADRMGLAEITVAKHLRTARVKLGSKTREQALIKAMHLNLLTF